MTKRYGVSLGELLSLDYEELEARTAAYVARLKAETPCPLQEVLDDLERDSEEPTVRTNNQSTLS